MDKPVLSKQAFKNVDMDNIDFEKDMLNILERVVYRGSPEDFMAVRKFYGDKRTRKEIIHTKCFGPKEINFCCFIFKLKNSDFIYYKEGQFRAYPEFKDCPEDFEYPSFAHANFQGTS
jgi:hypothetical protein